MKINLQVSKRENISVETFIPSDKSISHRSIILGSMAKGRSTIKGLLESEDVLMTMEVFKKLGVMFNKDNGIYIIDSKGYKNFKIKGEEENFYMGNSGTSCRLLMGILANIEGNHIITGDTSLQKRPMLRAVDPLSKMGADISFIGERGFLPIDIKGSGLKSISYELPVASAQVKSSLLLAGLFLDEAIMILEPNQTRDHTEIMLKNMGVNIDIDDYKISGKRIFLNNRNKDIKPFSFEVKGDFSSCSFLIALGLISKDSIITIRDVNLNPLRVGLLEVLKLMDADIKITNERYFQGEKLGDITAKHSKLKGVSLERDIVASMIDEFPILFVLASFASGASIFKGIEELRYKESDRIATMVENLRKLDIKIEDSLDEVIIEGNSGNFFKGEVQFESYQDHRIAMSCIILGNICERDIIVRNCENINTSFPNFLEKMLEVGMKIKRI